MTIQRIHNSPWRGLRQWGDGEAARPAFPFLPFLSKEAYPQRQATREPAIGYATLKSLLHARLCLLYESGQAILVPAAIVTFSDWKARDDILAGVLTSSLDDDRQRIALRSARTCFRSSLSRTLVDSEDILSDVKKKVVSLLEAVSSYARLWVKALRCQDEE